MSDERGPGEARGGPDPHPGIPTAAMPETEQELNRLWSDPPGLLGRLKSVQNDVVGQRLMLTGFFFLILGGSLDSLAMRAQLAVPENTLISPQLYNELFTNHGSVTMFLVILPIFEGFAILVLPLVMGTRELPFPRLGAFGYISFLLGGLLYYSSTLFQLVPDVGWFAYTPLSGEEFSPGLAVDFWILGLGVAEIGAISAGIEIIIGVLKMRAPGMTLSRLPLFAWAMLVTAFMILFAFTPLIVGSFLLELDRGFGMQFYDPQQGGSSLLWQHLFWIFGHPEVYIQFLPATGIVSMIIPVFARHRMVGYTWQVGALVAIAFLSFALWAHHMFTTGLPTLVLSFFAGASMVIAIPAGVQIFSWLTTIWAGKPVWKTPMLFVMGFLFLFVIGGITGVMVASVPFDYQAHDSYFVVGHLHYVLIGGVAFPIFAGVYYWHPKFTGKLLNERLGKWNFWLLFIGTNVAFFPMHIVGLMGMPRRVYTYPEGLGWGIYNLISTVGVVICAAGIAVFVLNIVYSRYRGAEAGRDPWGGDTLEWATESPPVEHGWSVHPIVHSRHPLWDQEELHSGDDRLERFVNGLSQWPLRWRAALIVGTGDGRPEEVFRVAGPSIWPAVAAFGVLIVFAAELLKLRWGLLVGAVVIIAAAIRWNWPEPAVMSEEEELAFEAEHDIPVRAGGSVVVARWGMGVSILFLGIAFSALLLAYFYLRLENAAWPPPAIPLPDVTTLVITSVLLLASGAGMHRALRSVRDDDQSGLRVGLAVAAVLALAAIVVEVVALHAFDVSPQDHAYASVFYTLGGFLLAVAGGGVIMAVMNLVWSLKGYFTARRHTPVANAARFWAPMTAMWLLGFGTLYLAPYLT